MNIVLSGSRVCPQCLRRKPPLFPHICNAPVIQRALPVFPGEANPAESIFGTGQDWARPVYGEYYARSVPVYAAIRKRADNLVRPPLRVFQVNGVGEKEELDRDHPYAALMRKVNTFWTRSDLIRATSTYLDLWGSAYWVLVKRSPSSPPTEIWPVRPDKMRVLAGRGQTYIEGFRFEDGNIRRAYLPNEVVWFRYFNPLAELNGFSPVAAARLSADMGIDAEQYNRNVFRNGILAGGLVFTTPDPIPEDEAEDFRKRLSIRFSTPGNAHRPIIAAGGMDVKNLGLSLREMEYMTTLRWGLENVARVFQVPLLLLEDLTHATYSNVDAAERMFWRNTIVPQLMFLQETINEFLSPQFGNDLIVEFDLSEIEALQVDAQLEAQSQLADIVAGVRTINEVRAERGLEPVPWGDAWWAPLSQYPVKGGGTVPPASPGVLEGKEFQLKTESVPSEHHLQAFAEAHGDRLERLETRFKSLQRQLFREQRDETQRRMAEQQDFPSKDLFSPDEWRDRFALLGLPLILSMFATSGQETSLAFGLGTRFDSQEPAVRALLDERVHFWENRVNADTARLLTEEIAEGLQAGESIKTLQARIEKVFNFSDAVRSERIARTETQWAMNRGSVEAYSQSGVVEGKIWLATLDDRTREDHLVAHGQTVALDDMFTVGGERLAHPGDGSPGQAINCRCTVAPVLANTRILQALNGVQKEAKGHG